MAKKESKVCNICGRTGDVDTRLQYPAFACRHCYRRWKRGLPSRRTKK